MGSSETLRSVIDTDSSSKRLDELSTARVIGKIAEQLHAAHQKAGVGKAIGPITPAGVTLELTGEVKLGLAEPTALAYSAPEQLGGGGDRRSDVFSLGVVMWEALTHQRLFGAADDAAVKVAVAKGEVTPPSELNANIPAELGAICMKALARNAADRYQSAKVMAAEIEAVLEEAGYADDDSKIAQFMAERGKPQKSATVTLSPPVITPAIGVPPPPVPVVPDSAPIKPPIVDRLPSILDKPPTLPPPTMSAASSGSLSPTSFVTPSTAPPAASGAALAAALAKVSAPAGKPAATILPDAEPSPSSTIPGAAPAPATPASPVLPTATSVPTVPGFEGAGSPPAITPTTSMATAELRPKLPPPKPDPPKLPAVRSEPPKPDGVVAAGESAPHPAAVVSLPGAKVGRESQELLAGWGWGTDSHPAIGAYEDDDDAIAAGSSRKPLLYVIGAGVALMLVVTVIAVGFSGGKKQKEPPPVAAAMTEGSAAVVTPAPPPPSGSDTQVAAASGSDIAGSAMSGSDTAGSAAAGSDSVGSANVAGSGTGSSAPVAAATPDVPKPDVPKPDVPKPDVPKPDKVTKAEPVKPIVPAKPDKPIVVPKPKPEAVKIARTDPVKAKPDKPRPEPIKEPAKPVDSNRPNVETAYRLGLQQFMRGDTTAALASLRTSLAGNPNYPPTWRGLGLVFEKMGEKDQARAAFKRYLQLAPTAGDADQVRNRLDRLGS